MSRKLLCVCAVVGILAGVARADEKADLKKENAELKKKIERLEGEIAKMKAEAKAQWHLEIKPLDPKWQLSPRIVPSQPLTITPPSVQTLPRGTVEKKFNGETFYVIPVSGNVSVDVGCGTVAVPAAVAPAKK